MAEDPQCGVGLGMGGMWQGIPGEGVWQRVIMGTGGFEHGGDMAGGPCGGVG